MSRHPLECEPKRRWWRADPEGGAGSSTVGVLLTSALALWGFLSHPSLAGAAFAVMVLAGAGAWMAGAATARQSPVAPGLALAAVVATSILVTLPESLDSGAAGRPIDYENANAALAAAALAGVLHCTLSVKGSGRLAVYGIAALFVVAAYYIGSDAGFVTALLLMVAWPVLLRVPVPVIWAVSAVVLSTGFVTTVVLGATFSEASNGTRASDMLSEERLTLWSESLDIVQAHPVRGVGAGSFASHSPTAQADRDLSWAHSAPLQVTAELGLIGLLLAVALVVWAFWRLGRFSGVLTILALQPLIDYVLHFPAVLVSVSFVLGAFSAASQTSRRRSACPQPRAQADV